MVKCVERNFYELCFVKILHVTNLTYYCEAILFLQAHLFGIENVQTFALINDARGNSAGIHVQTSRVTYKSLIKLFNVSVSDQTYIIFENVQFC